MKFCRVVTFCGLDCLHRSQWRPLVRMLAQCSTLCGAAKWNINIKLIVAELADFCCKEDKVTFFGGEMWDIANLSDFLQPHCNFFKTVPFCSASPDGAYTDCMRFSFAYLDKETIEEGIMKVAKRISSLTSQ